MGARSKNKAFDIQSTLPFYLGPLTFEPRPFRERLFMTNPEINNIAQAVIARMSDSQDPRFKAVMASLVKHVHAFLQEMQITPQEWINTIDFLTATGKMCDEKRQEFILLSDTLGVSMAVVATAQAHSAKAHKSHPSELAPAEANFLGPNDW